MKAHRIIDTFQKMSKAVRNPKILEMGGEEKHWTATRLIFSMAVKTGQLINEEKI